MKKNGEAAISRDEFWGEKNCYLKEGKKNSKTEINIELNVVIWYWSIE